MGTIDVCILAYRGAQLASLHGLKDLLDAASRFHADTKNEASLFTVTICDDIDAVSETEFSVVVLPPSLNERLSETELSAASNWVARRHARGALICSVCAGAFILAAAGLLDRRPATTHWALTTEFARAYPDVLLDTDKLVIDDGDIITAGGLMAWIDLGLRLVDRFAGPSVMLSTARFFLVDPGGREQRFYSFFSPRMGHGDSAILKVQHWLQTDFNQPVSVQLMAEKSGLGLRTFARRFDRATGLNPSEYLQQLRIGKAREMMALSDVPIDQVAWNVGYEDTSSFRRTFRKITGMTPVQHRRRFALSS